MKVFLSHSTRDGEFTLRLDAALRAEGITTFACENDIERGDDFVSKIDQALKDSDLYLLVWSPDAAASKWTEKEWTAAYKREVEESRTRLAVLWLRDLAT